MCYFLQFFELFFFFTQKREKKVARRWRSCARSILQHTKKISSLYITFFPHFTGLFLPKNEVKIKKTVKFSLPIYLIQQFFIFGVVLEWQGRSGKFLDEFWGLHCSLHWDLVWFRGFTLHFTLRFGVICGVFAVYTGI